MTLGRSKVVTTCFGFWACVSCSCAQSVNKEFCHKTFDLAGSRCEEEDFPQTDINMMHFWLDARPKRSDWDEQRQTEFAPESKEAI